MAKNNIVALHTSVSDPMQEVSREGARRLLARAIDAEVTELLDQHPIAASPRLAPAWFAMAISQNAQVLTGIGLIDVRIPKVLAKVGGSVRFRSNLVTPNVRKTEVLETALP